MAGVTGADVECELGVDELTSPFSLALSCALFCLVSPPQLFSGSDNDKEGDKFKLVSDQVVNYKNKRKSDKNIP